MKMIISSYFVDCLSNANWIDYVDYIYVCLFFQHVHFIPIVGVGKRGVN